MTVLDEIVDFFLLDGVFIQSDRLQRLLEASDVCLQVLIRLVLVQILQLDVILCGSFHVWECSRDWEKSFRFRQRGVPLQGMD